MTSQSAQNPGTSWLRPRTTKRNLSNATIQSVISQTVPPSKWIIVSDASTDRTDEIVQHYQDRYPYVQLMRITEEHPRNFAAQVYAINAGCRELMNLDFDFIGNLDADVTFAPCYFERVLDRFVADPELGLTGGWIFESRHGQYRSRSCNRAWSVAHAVQFFRRACFEQVGGYVALNTAVPTISRKFAPGNSVGRSRRVRISPSIITARLLRPKGSCRADCARDAWITPSARYRCLRS